MDQRLHLVVKFTDYSLNLLYKDWSGNILYLYYCQQIPWKALNQQWIDPTNKSV